MGGGQGGRPEGGHFCQEIVATSVEVIDRGPVAIFGEKLLCLDTIACLCQPSDDLTMKANLRRWLPILLQRLTDLANAMLEDILSQSAALCGKMQHLIVWQLSAHWRRIRVQSIWRENSNTTLLFGRELVVNIFEPHLICDCVLRQSAGLPPSLQELQSPRRVFEDDEATVHHSAHISRNQEMGLWIIHSNLWRRDRHDEGREEGGSEGENTFSILIPRSKMAIS
jgi:hypothetical protein